MVISLALVSVPLPMSFTSQDLLSRSSTARRTYTPSSTQEFANTDHLENSLLLLVDNATPCGGHPIGRTPSIKPRKTVIVVVVVVVVVVIGSVVG